MTSPHSNHHHYQDVPPEAQEDGLMRVENGEDDDDDLSHIHHASPHRRRRRLLIPTNPSNNNGCNVRCYLAMMSIVLLLTSIALVGRKDEIGDIEGGKSVPTEGSPKNDDEPPLVHYDPEAAMHSYNPLDLGEGHASLIQPPIESSSSKDDDVLLGYTMQPHSVNDTLVFVSEGDLYLSQLSTKKKQSMPAMKLTTTEGNVRTPLINPVYPYLIAYTATYTGRREAYLLDLRIPARPAMRLTYWDSPYGISSIVTWKDDGLTLVFSASSIEVGLPDVRLYQLSLEQDGNEGDKKNGNDDNRRILKHGPLRVWQMEPIPLSQAIDGVFEENCWYFVRFRQSSNTIRYVGGTAESLWAWCLGRSTAIPLTENYHGTDKAPSIVRIKGKAHLFFLSDRLSQNSTRAASMNLWSMPLPKEEDLYGKKKKKTLTKDFIQLTHVSCDFDGKSLVEYTVDGVSSNVVLRIGADLFLLKKQEIRNVLEGKSETTPKPQRLHIRVYSDFSQRHERILALQVPKDLTSVDVFTNVFQSPQVLLGVRGQLFVAPVYASAENLQAYSGSGMNLPLRRYRVAPGMAAGGMVRILVARHVTQPDKKGAKRMSLVLATDPKSDTAEHGFYLLEVQSDAMPSFVSEDEMPVPFLGGHVNGGSVADGGLGTVIPSSVSVSPCGRRLAWVDRDGRICAMNLPLDKKNATSSYQVLPQENEQGQAMVGTDGVELTWSPGGRYLAIEHQARNQFTVISIADCGDASEDVKVGRVVQATPDRFNSNDVYWGNTALDYNLQKQTELMAKLVSQPGMTWPSGATVLYFLSDRDVVSDVKSPWGTRQPSPHIVKHSSVYALPLVLDVDERGPLTTTKGTFGGGGAQELWVDNMVALEEFVEAAQQMTPAPKRKVLDTTSTTSTTTSTEETVKPPSPFPKDREIDFGPVQRDLSFARRAYRLGNIPFGQYTTILCQPLDDPSLVLLERTGEKTLIKIFSAEDFPSDQMDPMPVEIADHELKAVSLSTTREHVVLFFTPETTRVVENTAAGFVAFMQDAKLTKQLADTGQIFISIWPSLEYQQMYNDAWRMLRDYFYDPGMNGVDWPAMHSRYQSLVKRCSKREELDDVLQQMAAELSALHVFVYGGEYHSPLHGDKVLDKAHEVASLGATFLRSAEWKGYVVTSIPKRDPDFNLLDSAPIYSPLSHDSLRLSGQQGLEVGDVVVGINGESVLRVPDIHMLLRGMAGQSVRLDVLRLTSSNATASKKDIAIAPEPVICVPITPQKGTELRYHAWEWQTRETAKQLAQKSNYTVGYIHLQSMTGPNDIDAFVRGFYPDYDKDALIVDVRHNRGGNIDSWLLDVLQRKAWMYWQSRVTNITTGGLGWDEQFAFRGHLVVLIDEHTSSDGEGFSRGVSELGLGKLIGRRTWGGGIWLSSDNHLVDGGIATAPEVGTYNDNFGWGLGIEQMGVEPDEHVDNNPRTFYDGKDEQLEFAIDYLAKWLKDEPVVLPKAPGAKHDMSIPKQDCPAR